jgi:predicted DNA-binding transcriptional regulator AlpA
MNIHNSAVASTALETIASNHPERLIPAPAVASELGVTRRTLGRWLIDLNLGFPRPIEINCRLYFRRAELEAWKAGRLRRATGAS